MTDAQWRAHLARLTANFDDIRERDRNATAVSPPEPLPFGDLDRHDLLAAFDYAMTVVENLVRDRNFLMRHPLPGA
jgi:hypothetical protein